MFERGRELGCPPAVGQAVCQAQDWTGSIKLPQYLVLPLNFQMKRVRKGKTQVFLKNTFLFFSNKADVSRDKPPGSQRASLNVQLSI